MQIIGKQFIGGHRVSNTDRIFRSHDAATGVELPYDFYQASEEEAFKAAAIAKEAFHIFRMTGLEERAIFLETIADEIDALDEHFIGLVMRETGLPEQRIYSEKSRTSGQLRLFAEVVRRGDFMAARIDTSMPERKPAPRPDVRQYRIGVGPVAVFGASNFPLAFSVAGGDTASALAAGCPVVVKAHSSHPVTAELVGQAVTSAVERCNIPGGVFNMVFGGRIGEALVKAPEIKAVGFTGSLIGGRALFDMAAARPEPIPVFAEMSSINPIILMPQAISERGEKIAQDLADSVTLGAGQFCTNPGLVIGFKSEAFDKFCITFSEIMGEKPPAVMLNRGTLKDYEEGVQRMLGTQGVQHLAAGSVSPNRSQARVFLADARLLKELNRPLEEEVFGPCTTILTLEDPQELVNIVPLMNGHLTASLIAEEGELGEYKELISALEYRVGRLIYNQYPTGVEVCDAMVHGGPYPATTDSRGTSVGTLAIDRFLRPVCYQNYPDTMLPPALQNNNPLKLRRLVNGEWSDKPVGL